MEKNTGLKERLQKRAENAVAAASFAAASIGMLPVHANEIDPVKINTGAEVSADDIIGIALGLVMKFAQWIGVFFIIYGAFMLFLAMKNDEPESKSRSIMVIGCGIGLFCLRTLLGTLGGIIS